MTAKALSENLKDSGIGVTEISIRLGVSRQTVYNYIQYYEDGEIEKIPNVVFRIFEMCSNDDGKTEAKDYWDRETDEILVNMGRMTELKDKLAKLEIEYHDLLKNHSIDSEAASVEKMKFEEVSISNKIKSIEAELARTEEKIQILRKNLITSAPSSRDSQIVPIRGKRGNPVWKGNDVQTVCISDGNEHMVIVKDAESSALAVVEFYALIDDADVLLEKHEIPRGSNIVRISLIPKLNYSYRVIEYTNDGVKTTGMMELKNYFRTR